MRLELDVKVVAVIRKFIQKRSEVPSALPGEANPPLIVDPNAALTGAV